MDFAPEAAGRRPDRVTVPGVLQGQAHARAAGGGWAENSRELSAQEAACELRLWPAPGSATVRCSGPDRVPLPPELACAPAAVSHQSPPHAPLATLCRFTAAPSRRRRSAEPSGCSEP